MAKGNNFSFSHMKKKNIIVGSTLGMAMMIGTVAAIATSFSDVPEDHWAASAISAGVESGLWEGYQDNTFRPNNPITRAEVSVLMDRNNKMMMDKMDMMEKEMMMIHLENLSASQTLSPGLVVIHDDTASLNWMGEMAPAEVEALAEWGDGSELKMLLEGMDGVMAVYMSEAMAPGAMQEVMLSKMYENMHVSVITMAVGSNDGYALVDSMKLEMDEMMTAKNYDAGTEENSDLLSGFEGGQPDGNKTAEENMNAGTPTDPKENVSVHAQLVDGLLKAMVK